MDLDDILLSWDGAVFDFDAPGVLSIQVRIFDEDSTFTLEPVPGIPGAQELTITTADGGELSWLFLNAPAHDDWIGYA